MEISNLYGFNQNASEVNIKSRKKEDIKKSSSKKSFGKELKKASSSLEAIPTLTGEEQMAQLMDDLFEFGESLVKDPTMNNLRNYRNSVSLFFKYVVKNGLEFNSVEGRLNPKTFERKCYSLISVVDKKIDAIAQSVLGEQRKQFNILAAVEEINGLIVDLVS